MFFFVKNRNYSFDNQRNRRGVQCPKYSVAMWGHRPKYSEAIWGHHPKYSLAKFRLADELFHFNLLIKYYYIYSTRVDCCPFCMGLKTLYSFLLTLQFNVLFFSIADVVYGHFIQIVFYTVTYYLFYNVSGA